MRFFTQLLARRYERLSPPTPCGPVPLAQGAAQALARGVSYAQAATHKLSTTALFARSRLEQVAQKSSQVKGTCGGAPTANHLLIAVCNKAGVALVANTGSCWDSVSVRSTVQLALKSSALPITSQVASEACRARHHGRLRC